MILMGIGAYGMDYLGKYTIKAQEVLFAAVLLAAPPLKARFTRAHTSVVSVPVCRFASLTERTCARMNWCVCSLSPGLMFWVYCCIVVCAWCLHSASIRMALDMGVPGASLQLVHVIHFGPYFARPDNCLCARNK